MPTGTFSCLLNIWPRSGPCQDASPPPHAHSPSCCSHLCLVLISPSTVLGLFYSLVHIPCLPARLLVSPSKPALVTFLWARKCWCSASILSEEPSFSLSISHRFSCGFCPRHPYFCALPCSANCVRNLEEFCFLVTLSQQNSIIQLFW